MHIQTQTHPDIPKHTCTYTSNAHTFTPMDTYTHNHVCTHTMYIQVCKAQTYTRSWEIALMQQKNESALYTINKLTKVILMLFTARDWSHSKYMNFILPCLIYGSSYMLYQCIPCWRNTIDTSTTICEEVSPTIVDIFHCRDPVIQKVCKPLNDSHTIFVWIETVTWFWKSCEHRCCFIKHLPCSSCCQRAISTKGRNSVTISECTPESTPPHLSPKTAAKLWIGIQRLFTTAPNSKLSCLSPVEAKPSKQEMAMTTISVSTLTTVITSWSWLARFLTCTKILVSASSWLHGASWVLLRSELFERTWLPLVMTSSWKTVSVTTFSASKWNSSVLLPSTCRKDFQFLRRAVPFATFIRLVCPFFDLVADLMLCSM